MDILDKKLLNTLQRPFSLTPLPFAEIGEHHGIGEEEVFERIRRLKDEGILRQISAIFDTRSLGYKSSLVAMKVAKERIDEAAEVVNQHPGVSHNYKRDHAYNLWFTVACPPTSDLEATVQRLHKLSGAEMTRILPTLKLFKIGVELDMTGQQSLTKQKEPAYHEAMRRKDGGKELTAEDIAAIRELQKDVELVPKPFEAMARRLGWTEEELLRRAQVLQQKGFMRRFSAVLNHRDAGFTANAMGVWAVPTERAEEVGVQMASFQAVSHCYLRPTYEDWPYNIFTMVHGRNIKDCQKILDAISEKTDITNYTTLYSTKEYKKVRLKYFTQAQDKWERENLGTAVSQESADKRS